MSVELRKAKKDDQLSKRRNLDTEEDILDLTDKVELSFTSIQEIINGINSPDEVMQLQATQACRKLLSREKNPPISSIIEGSIVERCVKLLDCNHK